MERCIFPAETLLDPVELHGAHRHLEGAHWTLEVVYRYNEGRPYNTLLMPMGGFRFWTLKIHY